MTLTNNKLYRIVNKLVAEQVTTSGSRTYTDALARVRAHVQTAAVELAEIDD